MSKSQSTLIGLAVVLVGILGVGFMLKNKPQPPKKPIAESAPLVNVISPEKETVRFNVTSHGVVQPRTETTLVTEVSGVIQSVSDQFVAGGFFKAGEVLLTIDSTDYEVAVEQARARLASSKAKYEQEKARAEQAQKEWDLSGRSRTAAPSLALRKPFLAEAEANMLSAKADLKKAEQKLARTVIRAPYDGMVKTKIADVGQFVGVGTQLGVTFAIDYAEIRLPLTNKDLAYISVPKWNQNNETSSLADVVLSAEYAGKILEWPAKLVRMEGVVDQQSRVHYAVARIADPYNVIAQERALPPLKIGSFVNARIKGIEASDVVKIPRNVFKDLKKVLVTDKEKKLFVRELNIVRAESDYVYVDGGLEEGDRIVTTAIESPVQGMAVRVEGEPELNPESEETKEMIAITGKETQPRQ